MKFLFEELGMSFQDAQLECEVDLTRKLEGGTKRKGVLKKCKKIHVLNLLIY
jgi:hypothetical protein